jgi:hypothetical protein
MFRKSVMATKGFGRVHCRSFASLPFGLPPSQLFSAVQKLASQPNQIKSMMNTMNSIPDLANSVKALEAHMQSKGYLAKFPPDEAILKKMRQDSKFMELKQNAQAMMSKYQIFESLQADGQFKADWKKPDNKGLKVVNASIPKAVSLTNKPKASKVDALVSSFRKWMSPKE